ncbi:MAG TPA: phage holin family protein [Marmoricola sp.]|nr:phage holin family protein [Marmoricola sp.]
MSDPRATAQPSAARPVAAEPTAAQMPAHARGEEPTTAELLNRLSAQSTELVRKEIELAKVEVTEKAKHLGLGAGLFSTAGLLALYGLAAAIATAMIALALVLPWWLSALIVTVLLFVAAGVAALVGKKQVQQGSPPVPEHAIASTRLDVEEVKEARHRDDTV